jgi:hypothetical protein
MESVLPSRIFFGFHVPIEWAESYTENEYFVIFITMIHRIDLSQEVKNKILQNVVMTGLRSHSFAPHTLEKMQHLMYQVQQFSPRPYLFSHEYPRGGAPLLGAIEFDIVYHYKSHTFCVLINDYIGEMSALFDTLNGVVYLKSNEKKVRMKYNHFVIDDLILAETPEWHRLPIREDLFGYRAYRKEIIATKITAKIPKYEMKPLIPSFRTPEGNHFTETMLSSLLEEMTPLNETLWNTRMEDSTENDSIVLFEYFLELFWFVHNYVNFNISFHYSMWKEI